MESKTSTITGRCLCGRVAYEYSGTVGEAKYCHCEDCRRCTGSAFNVGVRLRLAEFRITAGDPRSFTKSGDSGRELTRHFCSDCGSPLFTSAPRHPEHVYVKAGTLDDPTIIEPAHENWVASAVHWRQIGPEVRSFTKGSA